MSEPFPVGTKIVGKFESSGRYTLTKVDNGFGVICKSTRERVTNHHNMVPVIWVDKKGHKSGPYSLHLSFFKEAKMSWKERLDVMGEYGAFF